MEVSMGLLIDATYSAGGRDKKGVKKNAPPIITFTSLGFFPMSSDSLRCRVAIRCMQANQLGTHETHTSKHHTHHQPTTALPRIQLHCSPNHSPEAGEQSPACKHHQMIQSFVVDSCKYCSNRRERAHKTNQGSGSEGPVPAVSRPKDAASHCCTPGEPV